MATKFYYPTFRREVKRLDNFLHRHMQDMITLNSITDPQLTQLNTLKTALDAINLGGGWPDYTELG